jgi:hypothetical protein
MRQLRLGEREIADRLTFLSFVQPDADRLVSLRPWVLGVADRFLSSFYDEQFSFPDFVAIVERAGSDRARLERFQCMYLLQLFDGMPDAAYVESRLRIGALHAQIGVTPRWYVSSYGLYEKYLFPMIRRRFRLWPPKGRIAIAALSKLLNFDKALVLDMYIDGVTEDLRQAAIGERHIGGPHQASELMRRMHGGV